MGCFVLAIDQGTTDFCESLRAAGHDNIIKRKSGLVLDPYFSASKYRWLLKNTPGISRLLQSPAEVRKIWQAEREFKVQMSAAARRKRTASWNTALQRTLL